MSMAWPTIGSKTAKEQNRTRTRRTPRACSHFGYATQLKSAVLKRGKSRIWLQSPFFANHQSSSVSLPRSVIITIIIIIIIIDILKWPKQPKLLQGPLFWRGDDDWENEMSLKSNSFVAAAEQVCLQPVLEHRQRRGRRNIAWQAVPHLCCSIRKGTTSDS